MNCRIWKCFYIFWKAIGFDILNTEIVQCKPTIIKSIVTSELLQCSGVHCTVHHTVCDVIIARSCGTLPPFAAILLVLDCVVELWISLCLKAVMYIFSRLGSFLFCFAKPIDKGVCNSPLKVEPAVLILLSISADGDNVVFLAIPAGTAAFACAVRFTPTWSGVCD